MHPVMSAPPVFDAGPRVADGQKALTARATYNEKWERFDQIPGETHANNMAFITNKVLGAEVEVFALQVTGLLAARRNVPSPLNETGARTAHVHVSREEWMRTSRDFSVLQYVQGMEVIGSALRLFDNSPGELQGDALRPMDNHRLLKDKYLIESKIRQFRGDATRG